MELARHSDTPNVHRLQPLRILLAGQDRRFLRVTALLLALRGYEVAEAAFGDTVRATERHHADVVILEAGVSRAAAGRLVAELGAVAAPPAVMIVTEDNAKPWSGFRTVEKWKPVDELIREIEATSLERHLPAAGWSGT
jgi:DNA-binding NtrC family response regulator